ncbi:hypothetical protein COCMIDRAFT_37002 [Bipolaris oryzae ATCC 44560]|uniref:Uncharacterized protein n=1 Tax=Bipolaris oryzae ATCC 44560 TaxID=930090 RepID=W6Z0F3_COCMI|nr:uncharacterized protein COCMIDRAFT_37002 [Bipolaris oryzae ATCC 44560]EUC45222.1 hypothetical protein COCMIDRAFT_37002 [Bipolaris oryzae ATCC 44560]
MSPAPLDACKHTPSLESSVYVTYIVLHIYPISHIPAKSLPLHTRRPALPYPDCANRFTPPTRKKTPPTQKRMPHLLPPQSYAFLPRFHHHHRRRRQPSTPTTSIPPPPQMSLITHTLTYALALITLSTLALTILSLSTFYTTLFTSTGGQQLHMLFHASVVGATVLMATLVADDVAAKVLGLHGIRYQSGTAADAMLMALFWVNVGVGGGVWAVLLVKEWVEKGFWCSVLGV